MPADNTLKAMIQTVHDELAFNPKAKKYKNAVRGKIQRAYDELVAKKPWLFAQREDTLLLLAEVEGSSALRLLIDTATNARLVTVDGSSTSALLASWVGATFTHADGSTATIGRVDTTANTMYLDTTMSADMDSSNYESWSVKQERILLPADCVEVLGHMDRSQGGAGRIKSIARRTEERAHMDRDTTGTPAYKVEDDWLTLEAPLVAPTLTATATASTLPVRTWAYCYTLVWAGRESAPSPHAEVTTTTGNETVQLSALDEVRWYAAGSPLASGWLRRIYRRDVTNDGPWLRIADIASTATTHDDSAFIGDYAASRAEMTRLSIPSSWRTFRPWSVPDADTTWHIRYRVKPAPLVGDTDVPIIPAPFHNVIVYQVLADLLTGSESAKFQVRHRDQLKILEDKFLTPDDETQQVESWLPDMTNGRYPTAAERHLGAPSVT